MFNTENLFVKKTDSKICSRFIRRFGDIWRGRNLNHVDIDTLNWLRARTWCTWIGVILFHAGQIIAESGSYFEPLEICDDKGELTKCVGEYREDFLHTLRPITSFLMRFIVVCSALGCIACYKWRYFADYFNSFMYLMHTVAAVHINFGMYMYTQTTI